MSNPKAQAAKENGNAAFKAGDYPTAIGHYTSAILADRADATYPLNRAAAYLKLGKFEDAERDCSTVLSLNPRNVKALFRQGQARVGMNKLREAQKDFSDVLLTEPMNVSAQEELKKVTALIQNEGAKKSKSPGDAMKESLGPAVASQRRRVPIKIIDPTGSVSSHPLKPEFTLSASPTKPSAIQAPEVKPARPTTKAPTTKPEPAQPTKATKISETSPTHDTLQAISSRSLKSSTPPTVEPVPPALAAAAASLMPSTSSSNEPPAVKSTFKDAKQARETAKPSRVGGGIFRSSGQNTIFPTQGKTPVNEKSADSPKSQPKAPQPSAPSQTNSAPERSPVKLNKTPAPIHKAPANLFDFNKTWASAGYPEEKWQLINTIPAAQFPAFCKNSLEPALLSSILETFVDMLSTANGDGSFKAAVLEYMDSFPKISRFSTLVLFLSRPEKAVAKRVWELLGVDKPAGAWSAVA